MIYKRFEKHTNNSNYKWPYLHIVESVYRFNVTHTNIFHYICPLKYRKVLLQPPCIHTDNSIYNAYKYTYDALNKCPYSQR